MCLTGNLSIFGCGYNYLVEGGTCFYVALLVKLGIYCWLEVTDEDRGILGGVLIDIIVALVFVL